MLDYLTGGIPDALRENVIKLRSKQGPQDYLKVVGRLRWAHSAWQPALQEQYAVVQDWLQRGCPIDETANIMNALSFMGFSIKSEEIYDYYDPDDPRRTRAKFRCTITDPFGNCVTMHGSETMESFPLGYYEKAETIALGRALLALGFGTDWIDALTEEDEGGQVSGKLADSPKAAKPARPTASEGEAPRATRAARPAPAEPAPKTSEPVDTRGIKIRPETRTKLERLAAEQGMDYVLWALRKMGWRGSGRFLDTATEYDALVLLNHSAGEYLRLYREQQGETAPEAAAAVQAAESVVQAAAEGSAPPSAAPAALRVRDDENAPLAESYRQLLTLARDHGGWSNQDVMKALKSVRSWSKSLKEEWDEADVQSAIVALQALPA